jgi:ribosomal subunit interface protein
MQVIVQGQQVDVGEALRGYVQEKIEDTCAKFFSHTIQGNVHFARESTGFRTDITLTVGNGITLSASANDPADPYPAFDQANSKLMKQLKRYKDRLRDHHKKIEKGDFPLPEAANEYTLSDAETHGEGGDNPVTLAEMPTRLDTLSVSEAVMRLDLGDLPALLFKNGAHGRMNMVYRRADGNIGWVDPQEK